MKMKMKIGSVVVAAGLALSTSLALAAGNVQGKRFGDWGAKCEVAPDKTQVCYLQQVLSEKGKNAPLLVTVMGYGQGKKFPTAIFELPKGVDMRQGVQMKVDKYPAISFKGNCDQTGCRAGFTLDNQITQQMTKGKQALLAYRPGPNKEPVILPISLNGLGGGLHAVK